MTKFDNDTLYYVFERSYGGCVYLLPDMSLETRTFTNRLHVVGERGERLMGILHDRIEDDQSL